jgi:hypothetical protein
VREVFTNIFEKAPADDPMLLAMKDVPKAKVVEEEVKALLTLKKSNPPVRLRHRQPEKGHRRILPQTVWPRLA